MTAPQAKRSAGEIIVTVLLGVLAAMAAAAAVGISPFFVMATDACGPDNCDTANLSLAYVVTWGGAALAVLVGVAGVVRAVRRHRRIWVWPASALGIVAVSFALGALLAMSVTPG